MIKTNMDQGKVLVTVATGELSPADEERTGLVPTHAYAVLDAKVINVRFFRKFVFKMFFFLTLKKSHTHLVPA